MAISLIASDFLPTEVGMGRGQRLKRKSDVIATCTGTDPNEVLEEDTDRSVRLRRKTSGQLEVPNEDSINSSSIDPSRSLDDGNAEEDSNSSRMDDTEVTTIVRSGSSAGTTRYTMNRLNHGEVAKTAGGTIIVCPMSLLGQWMAELEAKVKPGVLQVS